MENALIGRISEIGRMVEARDRIVQEALSCLGGEAVRLREEEDLARRRLSKLADTVIRSTPVGWLRPEGEVTSVTSIRRSIRNETAWPCHRSKTPARSLSHLSAMASDLGWWDGR